MLRDVVGSLDLVCLMSVNPGFGGQSFIERTYEKTRASCGPQRLEIAKALEMRRLSCSSRCDGGVGAQNASCPGRSRSQRACGRVFGWCWPTWRSTRMKPSTSPAILVWGVHAKNAVVALVPLSNLGAGAPAGSKKSDFYALGRWRCVLFGEALVAVTSRSQHVVHPHETTFAC